MEKSGTKRKSSRGKSKFQSVEIIRDNQPLKFRQNSSKNKDDEKDPQNKNQDDDADWEEGCIPSSSTSNNINANQNNGVTIEFDALPNSPKKKRIRRATAEDKVNIHFSMPIKFMTFASIENSTGKFNVSDCLKISGICRACAYGSSALFDCKRAVN